MCIFTANFFWLSRLHLFFFIWFCYSLCSLVSLICSFLDTNPLDTISKKKKKTMMREKKKLSHFSDWLNSVLLFFLTTMNQCVISNNLNTRKYSFDIAKNKCERKKNDELPKKQQKSTTKYFAPFYCLITHKYDVKLWI